MTLVRWAPGREIDSLQREMNRLFDDVFSALPVRSGLSGNGLSGNGPSGYTPAAELSETDEAYQLKLEVPGISAEDIDIQATAESVAISGERKSEVRQEENGVTRSEFRYGSFQRVIPLPGRIDHQSIAADYKDGILQLTMPKAEEEKNKVVKVSVG